MKTEGNGTDQLIGYGNAEYDLNAKLLLGQKQTMAFILKRVVPEFKETDLKEIAEHCIEGEPLISRVPVNPGKTNAVPKMIRGDRNEDGSPTEGWITYDILFHARVPGTGERITLIINVEAQKTQDRAKLGYRILHRAVFYASRLISSQKEREFTGSDYDSIKKVYTIFICMDSPNGKNSINRYSLTEKHLYHKYAEERSNYDLMSIVIIYLGKDEARDKLINLLHLFFIDTGKSGEEKEKELQQKYHMNVTKEMRKELDTMCNLSEGIVDRTTERVTREVTQKVTEKVTRDVTDRVSRIKNISMVRNLMLSMNLTVYQAMDALKIPAEERKNIVDALVQA